MRLVWKLLRQHISIPQFVGFFFANLVGVVIILLGVQFYSDYRALDSEDSFMKSDYMIVNKKVSTMSSLVGRSSTFTKDEIKDLKDEPFVEKMGAFTPSSFNVWARFEVEGLARFSTEMFFESVPDEFVDVKSEAWKYREGSKQIPIILPKNYLDLYNFGYAQGKGLPKLSEGILGAMKLKIHIVGNDYSDEYDGRIVGFSSRLNTILVPEAFMAWGNKKYAGGKAVKEPTRLIMEVNNPTDDRIVSYLQEHNYETDESKLDASKTNFILRVVISIVRVVGVVISILSFYILMLSVFLLVQKNSTKLENLLVIGYSPTKVSFPYQVLTVGLNVLVLIISVIVMLIIRSIYIGMFENFFPDYDAPSIVPAMVVGGLLLVVVSIFNIIAVRQKVMSIWENKQ